MTTNFDRFCPFDLEWDIPGWGCGFEFAPLILNLDDSKEDHLEQVKRFFRAERPEMIEELENDGFSLDDLEIAAFPDESCYSYRFDKILSEEEAENDWRFSRMGEGAFELRDLVENNGLYHDGSGYILTDEARNLAAEFTAAEESGDEDRIFDIINRIDDWWIEEDNMQPIY